MLVAEHSDLLRKKAIERMRSPQDKSIICIDITNKYDLACSNCIRLLKIRCHFGK